MQYEGLLWQGLHVCEDYICQICRRRIFKSLPVNQSILREYAYDLTSDLLTDENGKAAESNWFSEKLTAMATPSKDPVDIKIEVREKNTEVIILNTLDYVYGHSLLFLFNLQRMIENRNGRGVIVIVQPALRWLVPESGIAEIWNVNLGFRDMVKFYPDLSEKINNQFIRFNKVFLSKGHLIPTNHNIRIEQFTGIRPFNFEDKISEPAVTFIWRQDYGRLWIRNIYLLKLFEKTGLGNTLLPLQYLRVLMLFWMLKNKLGSKFRYTVAGLGDSFRFPSFISDLRIVSFNEETERSLCRIYSESILVVGVHGSSMILPSGHSGMAVSLIPSNRWSNFAEDILYTETDLRLAAFQRRLLPLNMSVFDLRDVIVDMINGRDYFIKKFLHTSDL